MQSEQQQQLPKSKLAGAINYMLNRWDSFTRFLESGMVPMENNLAERALKYPILGRKAWLFVGNHEAGETAARLFTLTKRRSRLWRTGTTGLSATISSRPGVRRPNGITQKR